ncbi:MAG: AAA family ATPase [Rickettsiales bacterium]|jgi:DNA replication and repair protein RecF|nr:AAA family ATPase [Rickettsiales bacterium]
MITTLTLTDFRNHTASRIVAGAGKNIVITGPNGAGKTAVLEAISMLGGDRGLRGAPMTEIARFAPDFVAGRMAPAGGFSVFAELADDTEISVCFNPGDSNRRARVDGDNAALSDLSSRLRIVWLTPREDRLFVDSASERRAFFDRLVSSFDHVHSGRVAKLSKLLSERGFALKSGADTDWLAALDVQIARTAVAVAAARIRYAGEINYFFKNCAVSVSGPVESLVLNGTAADAEGTYLNYLAANRELQGDKMLVDGAHKSDFGVYNNALKLPASLTSTGQQKAVLIDLILAHAKLVRARAGKTPLVLLDEAAAHLDAAARARMFDELGKSGAQVWATGLDRDTFAYVPDAIFVACDNGKII